MHWPLSLCTLTSDPRGSVKKEANVFRNSRPSKLFYLSVKWWSLSVTRWRLGSFARTWKGDFDLWGTIKTCFRWDWLTKFDGNVIQLSCILWFEPSYRITSSGHHKTMWCRQGRDDASFVTGKLQSREAKWGPEGHGTYQSSYSSLAGIQMRGESWYNRRGISGHEGYFKAYHLTGDIIVLSVPESTSTNST